MSSIPPSLARGYAGEQSMGFFLGERGYFFVEGPSGSGGHGVTASGFDGVAFNPTSRHLIIYDNKAYARAGNVGGATAIDPARNLAQNLDALILRVQTMNDMPNQAEILDLLRQTRFAVQSGGTWPRNVDIAVSNASGQASGVSPRLAGSGIRFIDFYQAPTPVRRVLSNQDVMAFVGLALGAFFQWLGDIGIQLEVNRRLEGELAPQIRSILLSGDGVLIVIALQEWEQPDFNGMRARNLLSVYVEGGPTQESARARWENTPRALQGPAPGWRAVSQFGWIPPLD
jgi:hypothetical protein